MNWGDILLNKGYFLSSIYDEIIIGSDRPDQLWTADSGPRSLCAFVLDVKLLSELVVFVK